MTEDFIKIVIEEFPSWSMLQEQYIQEKNKEIKLANDRIQICKTSI